MTLETSRSRRGDDQMQSPVLIHPRFQPRFPHVFKIIRYPARAPLPRGYVTHRRVSVRVLLKRSMNYVDRSACGGSLCTLSTRSPGKRFWTVGKMVFTSYGFDGWIYVAQKWVTLYPLYRTSVAASRPRRHRSTSFSYYPRLGHAFAYALLQEAH